MEATLITIAGSIILIQFGIIGYYISKDNRKQEAINDRFFSYFDSQHKANEQLTESINLLNRTISVLQEKYEGLEQRYEEHKEVCRFKLEDIRELKAKIKS